MTLYRSICAVLCWAFILLQYVLLLQSGDFGGFASSTFNYLTYFTVLTNILVGFAFSLPLLPQDFALKRFFNHPTVRAAITLYIFVVMVVYWSMLAAIHNPTGLGVLANHGLHTIMPILFVIDWLFFTPKMTRRYASLPYWVIYPLAYGALNIIRGLITGFYPYPFLDIGTLGIGMVTLTMFGFTLFYFIGGAAIIALDGVKSNTR